MKLLVDRGADVNAKDKVSTCECTDVNVSVCVYLCVCMYVCMLLLSSIICTFRSAIIAIVLIPVVVGGVIG